MELQVKKLRESAIMPTRAHVTDAGMDIYTSTDITIIPGERVQVPTGIALAIPEGYVGLVWDKSGLSHKYGLKTLGGVVDAGYRGEIMVGLVNLGVEEYSFRAGDKVAQILIQKIETLEPIEVVELNDTERAQKGFGSTGA